ncbi:methyl-accepting chemotaxis protein [Roseobacter sp.]|uniref:methyl-accepting chemotaxis protein n=1 Tax=Roseobacter sp. TaxID=1907202 RepID=UPI00329715A7
MSRKSSMSPTMMIFCFSLGLFFCVIATALFAGNAVLTSAGIAAGFLALGGGMARSQPKLADIGAAVALLGQAFCFTSALQGHPWQLDTHMLYFALLATLVSLRSIPVLLAGAGLIAAHHLSLSFVMPTLIYPPGEFWVNLERTALHAVVVVLETAALVATVHRLNKINREIEVQTEELKASLEGADLAQKEALSSKEQAEIAQQDAMAAQAAAEDALAQAREADEVRKAAELEQKRSEEEHRVAQEAKSAEQAAVVDALRVGLTRLEGGDLTARITQQIPEDYAALQTGFNAAVQTLEELVSVVAQRSEQMDAEVRDISIATDDLARRTETQAYNLSETSQALDGLTKSVRENASSVEEAFGSSQGAQSSAQASSTVVSKASDAMQAIKSESEEIAKIVELIDGISFQTNLLALNAGVEAARAGDAGAGFAVVASEVRGLAQRSSESATSIRTLIERSGTEVENGSAQITETVNSLGTVESSISEITAKMDLISGSTQSQSDRISSLNASIAEMGAVTQKNAAMFEETNAACTNLANGAKALLELTQRFQVSTDAAAPSKVA